MTAILEKITKDFKLPFDKDVFASKDPVQITAYMLELVETLQALLEKIRDVANFGLDLFDGEALYSQLKNANGDYPIGTWRLIQVDNNWERQVQLTLGTWTFAGAFERPE